MNKQTKLLIFLAIQIVTKLIKEKKLIIIA